MTAEADLAGLDRPHDVFPRHHCSTIVVGLAFLYADPPVPWMAAAWVVGIGIAAWLRVTWLRGSSDA